MTITTTTARLALSAALLLGAGACGSDDNENAGAAGRATTTAAPAVTAETVAVTGVDYGYEGVPAAVAAGTTFTFTNSSKGEMHEIVAVRLPDTETRPAAEVVKDGAAVGKLFAGGPAAVIVAAPGSDRPGAVVGDGSLAEPGRYLFVCNIPTGADPAAYQKAASESRGGPVSVPGGPPHVAKGMFAEVTVEA